MHNAIVHHPLTDAQPAPEQQSLPPRPTPPPVSTLSMMSYGMEYPFGKFGSAALAVSPPSFSLAEHEKPKPGQYIIFIKKS